MEYTCEYVFLLFHLYVSFTKISGLVIRQHVSGVFRNLVVVSALWSWNMQKESQTRSARMWLLLTGMWALLCSNIWLLTFQGEGTLLATGSHAWVWVWHRMQLQYRANTWRWLAQQCAFCNEFYGHNDLLKQDWRNSACQNLCWSSGNVSHILSLSPVSVWHFSNLQSYSVIS